MRDIYVNTYFIEETAANNKLILIYTGACYLYRVLATSDAVNDFSFVAYDGINNTGDVIIPNAEYEADQKGIVGYTAANPDKCTTGLCFYVTCPGDMEVCVKWRPYQSFMAI